MRKSLLIPLFFFSVTINARPYLEYQYGLVTASHEYQGTFPSDNIFISLDEEIKANGLALGFKGKDGFSLELLFKTFETHNEQSKNNGDVQHTFANGTTANANNIRNWGVKLKGAQVSLSSMYFSKVTERSSVKAGLGLSLARYDHEYFSFDSFTNPNLSEQISRAGTGNKTDNAIGAIATVQYNYRLFANLKLGISAQYQIDHEIQSRQFLLSLGYDF